jgi:hypothetical protein
MVDLFLWISLFNEFSTWWKEEQNVSKKSNIVSYKKYQYVEFRHIVLSDDKKNKVTLNCTDYQLIN